MADKSEMGWIKGQQRSKGETFCPEHSGWRKELRSADLVGASPMVCMRFSEEVKGNGCSSRARGRGCVGCK